MNRTGSRRPGHEPHPKGGGGVFQRCLRAEFLWFGVPLLGAFFVLHFWGTSWLIRVTHPDDRFPEEKISEPAAHPTLLNGHRNEPVFHDGPRDSLPERAVRAGNTTPPGPSNSVRHPKTKARPPAAESTGKKPDPEEPFLDALDTNALEERISLDLLTTLVSEGRWEELASLPRGEIETLAQELSAAFSETEIASQLEQYLKIPSGLTMARGDIKETLLDLYDSAVGNSESHPSAVLTFTDQCTPEGLVTGHVNVMPKGTKRVYAVFDNTGNMAGREHVLAMWRDPSRADLVFAETERLRPHTRYNYVWLELDDGWPAGTFQLELYDPQIPSRMLAKQTFALR